MPILDPRVFDMATHEDQSLRAEAVGVLAHHQDERVRAFAVDRLTQGEVLSLELTLLQRNYKDGDHLLIEKTLQLPEDSFLLHRLGTDVLDVAEHQQRPELKIAVLFVYEHSPCSICREKAVKWLVQMKLLDAWIRDECKHDACQAVRAIAESDG